MQDAALAFRAVIEAPAASVNPGTVTLTGVVPEPGIDTWALSAPSSYPGALAATRYCPAPSCGAALTSTSTSDTIFGNQSSEWSSDTNSGFGRGLGSTARIFMSNP